MGIPKLVKLARPHHWIKNVFIVVPLPFAVMAGTALDLTRLLLGIVGFSSELRGLRVNDIKDASADRLNPKANRRSPRRVTFGPPGPGRGAAGAGHPVLRAPGSTTALVLTAVYVVANLAILRLKHVALVEFSCCLGLCIRVLLAAR